MEDSKSKFCHLHCHSDFSLYDGFQKVDAMAARASELNMESIALTDHGKVAGLVKFYKACKKNNVKPILGLEGYVVNELGNKKAKRYHQTILAKNKQGYENLLKLSTLSHEYKVSFFNNEFPCMDIDMMREHSSGLIMLSGCIAGEFSNLIVEKENPSAAYQLAKTYKDIWGDDYYIEVMYTNYAPQRTQIKHALKIAKDLDIKVVATNDAHYTNREDAKFQQAKIAISRNSPIFSDGEEVSEYYIKSYSEMAEVFNGSMIEYLHNTMEISEKCDITLEKAAELPHFEVPQDDEEFNSFKEKLVGRSEEESYLRFLSEKGLKERGLWDASNRDEEGRTYRERLNYELEIIRYTGFIRYFLIVWEYCNFARESDIMIGKGRGSGAGSLVLYSLGVIGVDPVKRLLSFDRFLFAKADYKAKVDDFFDLQEKEKNVADEECSLCL